MTDSTSNNGLESLMLLLIAMINLMVHRISPG